MSLIDKLEERIGRKPPLVMLKRGCAMVLQELEEDGRIGIEEIVQRLDAHGALPERNRLANPD